MRWKLTLYSIIRIEDISDQLTSRGLLDLVRGCKEVVEDDSIRFQLAHKVRRIALPSVTTGLGQTSIWLRQVLKSTGSEGFQSSELLSGTETLIIISWAWRSEPVRVGKSSKYILICGAGVVVDDQTLSLCFWCRWWWCAVSS